LFQGDTPFTPENFNCANDGSLCFSTPWGNSGLAGPIVVGGNVTLLVTDHLEWKYLRSAWPTGCSATTGCPIAVTGVIKDAATGTEIGRCTAAATGYRKN
jgi:hypothetical protein